ASHCSPPARAISSFPTRRSSDLSNMGGMSFDDGAELLPPPPEEDHAPHPDSGGGAWSSAAPARDNFGSGQRRSGRSGGRREEFPDLCREMQQNVDAEQGVLGGMLMNKDAISEVVEVLVMDDFYRPAHQTIFDVIVRLYGEGKEVDPVIVAGRLDRDGKL